MSAGHRHMATAVGGCGSYSSFTVPSFTPASANPNIAVINQLSIRINVHHVASQDQPPQQRMSIESEDHMTETVNTAGLWFVTDDNWIDILPLSNVDACYYVTGTSNGIIVVGGLVI